MKGNMGPDLGILVGVFGKLSGQVLTLIEIMKPIFRFDFHCF